MISLSRSTQGKQQMIAGAEIEMEPRPNEQSPIPVTVVVCARNRGSVIGRCLDSVRAANPAEIIVVDGNSTDETVAVARAKGVMVISDNGAGLGAARQLGASAARNDYVVFVDTDVVVEPDTLRLMLEEAKENNFDAVEAELRTLSPNPTYWQGAERWRRQVQMRKGVAAVLGCQVTLVRRALLLSVGFDPAFRGAAEDADFCYRARAVGAVVAHSTRAVAYHEDRGSLRDFIEQKIWHGRGLARMIARYGRSYLRSAAQQVDNSVGATRLDAKYLPYILVSWSFTGLGVALESVRIAFDAPLRQQLTSVRVA
jgi:glycosyltransferase involved in cell wall biosynthesis